MTAPGPLEERRVAHVIESSVLFGAADRVMARCWRALESSRAASAAQRVSSAWQALDTSARRLAIGVVLLSATLTHLALTWTGPPPPTWMWLILPGLFAALGLVFVAAAGARVSTKSPD